MATSIDIKDNATPAVKRVLEAASGPNINAVAGRAGVNRIQQHLFALNGSRPNKLGGKRTNFWAQCARSTSFVLVPEGALASINQIGFRQRLEGGVISARNAKFLTIPAIAEAYGKRAGEFHNLRFAIVGGKPALIEAEHSGVSFRTGTRGAGKVKATLNLGGKVYFWLKRSVRQNADPSVMPTNDEMGAAVVTALESYVKRVTERSPSGGAL